MSVGSQLDRSSVYMRVFVVSILGRHPLDNYSLLTIIPIGRAKQLRAGKTGRTRHALIIPIGRAK